MRPPFRDADGALGDGSQGAERVLSETQRVSHRLRELAKSAAKWHADLATLEAPDPVRNEVERYIAELASAEANLRELGEAMSSAIAHLAYERALKRVFFEQAADAQLVTSRSGRIRAANNAASQLLSLRREALQDKLLVAFVARGDTRAFRQWLQGFPGREPRSIQVRVRPRGGTPLLASLSVQSLSDTVEDRGPLHWTILPVPEHRSAPVPRQRSADLRARMAMAIDDPKSTLAAVHESAMVVGQQAERANGHASAVKALSRDAAHSKQPLSELERIVLETEPTMPPPPEGPSRAS